jgi:hypothetical protein
MYSEYKKEVPVRHDSSSLEKKFSKTSINSINSENSENSLPQ